MQTIQVDRVLSALRCCAGGEKQGIDMTDVPWYIEKNRRYHNPGNYVYIVDCDEGEVASVFPRGHSCAAWFISGGNMAMLSGGSEYIVCRARRFFLSE